MDQSTANSMADLENKHRAEIARQMVLVLPGFGRWASKIREFDTPYGSAGIRQLEVLYLLRHDLVEHPSATELAHFLGTQRSVVTRILAKLEIGGHIVRSKNPLDGRAQQTRITDKGRLLSDYVEQVFFDEMSQALDSLDAPQLGTLAEAMQIITEVAIRLNGSGPRKRFKKCYD